MKHAAASAQHRVLGKETADDHGTDVSAGTCSRGERHARHHRDASPGENVIDADQQMVAGDFSELGRIGIPAVQLKVGAAEPKAITKARAEGRTLPGLHSSEFAPDRERTIRTGVTAFTASAMELLGKP